MVITKDTTIGEALRFSPQAGEIMLNHGLHCIGCHVNPYESIELGARVHGIDDKTIDKIVKEINSSITKVKPKSLIVTSKAAEKIKSLLKAEKKPGYGLKIAVIPGGCSGSKYDLAFVKSPKKGDEVIGKDGARIFIDKDSIGPLNGTELDFVETLSESGFKFKNPNAKITCGCGDSFS